MPRKHRFNMAGMPVHVVQRGNNRQAVFYDERTTAPTSDGRATPARSTPTCS